MQPESIFQETNTHSQTQLVNLTVKLGAALPKS